MVTRCRANGYDADLAILDAPDVRCGLPVGGELTFGDWFNLMPFADTIRLCWIAGYQLKALLMDNARRADRPGEPHTERGFLHGFEAGRTAAPTWEVIPVAVTAVSSQQDGRLLLIRRQRENSPSHRRNHCRGFIGHFRFS